MSNNRIGYNKGATVLAEYVAVFSVGLVKSIKAFLFQTAFSRCDKVGLLY